MANAWFRMYSEFADDPKVQIMPEAMQRRLLMLMCSKCKDETLHETEMAFHWRVSETDLAQTKAVFLSKGFIDEDWNLLNWDKRQFISDSSTDRVRKYRRGMKQDETLHETVETKRNVTVTPPDTDTDTDTEKTKKEPFALPAWIDSETWKAYLELRSSKRAAKTPRAWNLVIKQLDSFRSKGHDPNAILETSIRSNWTDVYEPKDRPTGGNYGIRPDAVLERRRQNLANIEAAARRAESADGTGGGFLSEPDPPPRDAGRLLAGVASDR